MVPKEHLAWHHEDPLKDLPPIFNLLLYITMLVMALTYPAIQYSIMIVYIPGIWTKNCLIPLTDTGLVGGYRRTMERHDSLCLMAFPKDNLTLMQYMLSAWWLQLMYGLINYVI